MYIKRNVRVLIILVFGVIVTSRVAAEETEEPRVGRKPVSYTRTDDIIYGRKYGMALTMNLLKPAQTNGAAVLWIVSGGFFSSHQETLNAKFVARLEPLLRRGYTVFLVMHGSAPQFEVREITQDVHRAVRFVRFHASEYGIDPQRIGVTGSSAGGYLATWLGTTGCAGNATAGDPVDRVSSRVQAVACFFPGTDWMNFPTPGEDVIAISERLGTISGFRFRDYEPKKCEFISVTEREKVRDILKEVSPINHVTAEAAPMRFIFGDKDVITTLDTQAMPMLEKLKAAGVPCDLIVKPGLGHSWPGIEKDSEGLADWFDKHLLGLPLLPSPAVQSAALRRDRNHSSKPNIIIIFADDLGYGDLGCYGSTKNRTPALDKMAREGMKFTSFYVTSGVCSPSRASLMTGCYPLRVGLHESSQGCFVLVPADNRGLNPAEMTLPRLLKQQGYATMIIGKWHLGDQPPFFPRQYGFDEYFGIPFSNDMGSEVKGQEKNGLPELPLIRNDTVIEAPVDQNGITGRYTQEAIAFIERNKDKPFFLYLPHMQVHGPLRSGERFRGKSNNGPYGDSVEELDASTGEILEALKRLKLDENTLVVFTSDNGATGRGSNQPLSGGKATTLEGGMREPCLVRWPGKVPAGSRCDEVASTIDLLPTLAGLAGGSVPTDRAIDGKDITDLLLATPGSKSPHTEGFYYYFMSQLQAIRLGKWKVRLSLNPEIGGWTGQPKGTSEAQLYDLDTDIGEKQNVAAEHPEVVAQLTALADRARKEIGDYKVKGIGQREPGYVVAPKLIRMAPGNE